MSKQEQFFYDNAGFSFDLVTETAEQGHLRCARELAIAETWLRQFDYSTSFEPDPDSDESFMDSESEEYRAEWSGTAWYCQITDANDRVVASLGSCYGDSDYKRVVRAELALEVMQEVAVVELRAQEYAGVLANGVYC